MQKTNEIFILFLSRPILLIVKSTFKLDSELRNCQCLVTNSNFVHIFGVLEFYTSFLLLISNPTETICAHILFMHSQIFSMHLWILRACNFFRHSHTWIVHKRWFKTATCEQMSWISQHMPEHHFKTHQNQNYLEPEKAKIHKNLFYILIHIYLQNVHNWKWEESPLYLYRIQILLKQIQTVYFWLPDLKFREGLIHSTSFSLSSIKELFKRSNVLFNSRGKNMWSLFFMCPTLRYEGFNKQQKGKFQLLQGRVFWFKEKSM